jgi:chromosomal replication initiator protein
VIAQQSAARPRKMLKPPFRSRKRVLPDDGARRAPRSGKTIGRIRRHKAERFAAETGYTSPVRKIAGLKKYPFGAAEIARVLPRRFNQLRISFNSHTPQKRKTQSQAESHHPATCSQIRGAPCGSVVRKRRQQQRICGKTKTPFRLQKPPGKQGGGLKRHFRTRKNKSSFSIRLKILFYTIFSATFRNSSHGRRAGGEAPVKSCPDIAARRMYFAAGDNFKRKMLRGILTLRAYPPPVQSKRDSARGSQAGVPAAERQISSVNFHTSASGRSGHGCGRIPVKKILRAHLAENCAEDDLRSWYDPLQLTMDHEHDRLTVVFPHLFFGPRFAELGQKIFESCLPVCLGRNIAVHYRAPQKHSEIQPKRNDSQLPDSTGTFSQGKNSDPGYTLKNFISNKKNFFPVSVARAILETQKNPLYNPKVYCVVFRGNTGNGKTHILRAIADELHQQNNENAVFYGDIENFIYELKKKKKSAKFWEYTSYCIDDIHHCANNSEVQEEISLLFDHCLDTKKQFICSFSSHLSLKNGFSPALISRLERSIIAEIKDPDIDVRMRFAQTQCEMHNLDITREQMLLIAQRCEHLCSLSGIILKTAAYRKLIQNRISNQDIEKILNNANSSNHETTTPHYIINCVAEHYSLQTKEIITGGRKKSLVFARHAAIYLCRNLLRVSYPALGRIFGGKDHSTVMYAYKKFEKNILMHTKTHKEITELKNKCLQHRKNGPTQENI